MNFPKTKFAIHSDADIAIEQLENMNAYRVETVISQDRTLIRLNDLPFQVGESVEVIILQQFVKTKREKPLSMAAYVVRRSNTSILWNR